MREKRFGKLGGVILLLVSFLMGGECFAKNHILALSLLQAEKETLQNSNRLKSFVSDQEAATQQAKAQFANLIPRISLQANYSYNFNLPIVTLPIPGVPPLRFGEKNTYSVGPQLNYTLWDTLSNLKAYKSLNKMADSKDQDRKNAELQLLLSVRMTYIQVQLANEELLFINDSLELARAQASDTRAKYEAGAAARLDLVTAERSVLNYELQFKQRQSDLSSNLKDLLALIGNNYGIEDLRHPGPRHVESVTLHLDLDPLASLIHRTIQSEISPPDELQPQLLSQTLQAQSFELSASSQKAKLFPTLQISAGVTYAQLNIPSAPLTQSVVSASFSLPLYLGDPTPHLAAQQTLQADASRFREAQLRIDLSRDFEKAQHVLSSLKSQRKLAAEDIVKSEEEAKLYYHSYRAGKINMIDVQNANLQALQAKVTAVRIDAQILNQLATLKALSGKEVAHD